MQACDQLSRLQDESASCATRGGDITAWLDSFGGDSRWQGRRDWAHRPEDAADAVQDGEGPLEALHDAQPDQEVLQQDMQSAGRRLSA